MIFDISQEIELRVACDPSLRTFGGVKRSVSHREMVKGVSLIKPRLGTGAHTQATGNL